MGGETKFLAEEGVGMLLFQFAGLGEGVGILLSDCFMRLQKKTQIDTGIIGKTLVCATDVRVRKIFSTIDITTNLRVHIGLVHDEAGIN